MLSWMRRSMGGAAEGGESMLGALEQVFAPAATRARLDLESRREQVIPVPSPGERLLAERLLVIKAPKAARADAPGPGR